MSADTLRFGGNCPHCMLEIPGEEAPTDPGLQARQRQEQEEKVRQAAKTKRSRIAGVIGAVVLVAAGAGGFQAWKASQESVTYEMDDFYVLPLEDIKDAPPEAPPETAANTPGGDARPEVTPRKSGTGGTALAGTGRPASDGAALKSATGGLAGDAEAAAVSTALPGSGGGLGGGMIRVEQLGSDKVLTDPGEINDMMKRVINALSPQVQNCYTQRLKQVDSLKGAWDVAFVVTREGGTRNVRVSGVNGADGDLEGCIVRAVSAWKFQKIHQDSQVKKTYRFGASSW